MLFSLPTLYKLKKIDSKLSIDDQDKIIHELPKQWAETLVKLTGSKVVVTGLENIPNGPVLFVSNHQGNFDIPVILGFINKPVGFISKVEVKKIPIVPKWMEAMNCIFIDRNNRRQAIQSIKDGANILREGHSLVIFPEGTRSKGGAMKPFQTGGLRMAADAGVPIVPISINGSHLIMENGKKFFNPASVKVKVLQPVLPDSYENVKHLAIDLHDKISEQVNPQT
nr:lysophospholipid acyltransferase family protein [Fredinandcohnia sp. SECRCQ15]